MVNFTGKSIDSIFIISVSLIFWYKLSFVIKNCARSFKGTCFIIAGRFQFNIRPTKVQSFFPQAFNIGP